MSAIDDILSDKNTSVTNMPDTSTKSSIDAILSAGSSSPDVAGAGTQQLPGSTLPTITDTTTPPDKTIFGYSTKDFSTDSLKAAARNMTPKQVAEGIELLAAYGIGNVPGYLSMKAGQKKLNSMTPTQRLELLDTAGAFAGPAVGVTAGTIAGGLTANPAIGLAVGDAANALTYPTVKFATTAIKKRDAGYTWGEAFTSASEAFTAAAALQVALGGVGSEITKVIKNPVVRRWAEKGLLGVGGEKAVGFALAKGAQLSEAAKEYMVDLGPQIFRKAVPIEDTAKTAIGVLGGIKHFYGDMVEKAHIAAGESSAGVLNISKAIQKLSSIADEAGLGVLKEGTKTVPEIGSTPMLTAPKARRAFKEMSTILSEWADYGTSGALDYKRADALLEAIDNTPIMQSIFKEKTTTGTIQSKALQTVLQARNAISDMIIDGTDSLTTKAGLSKANNAYRALKQFLNSGELKNAMRKTSLPDEAQLTGESTAYSSQGGLNVSGMVSFLRGIANSENTGMFEALKALDAAQPQAGIAKKILEPAMVANAQAHLNTVRVFLRNMMSEPTAALAAAPSALAAQAGHVLTSPTLRNSLLVAPLQEPAGTMSLGLGVGAQSIDTGIEAIRTFGRLKAGNY